MDRFWDGLSNVEVIEVILVSTYSAFFRQVVLKSCHASPLIVMGV